MPEPAPRSGPPHREPRSLDALFALTVVVTLTPVVAALWSEATTRAALVAVAGFAHVALAVRSFGSVESDPTWRRNYFAVQSALLVTVLVASRCFGSAPIAAMPFLVQGGMVLTSRGAWTLAAAVLATIAATEIAYGMSVSSVLAYIVPGYGAAVLFSVLFARVLRNERDARAEVESLQAALQDRAAEQERLRIARDIHDGLGHTLTVIATRLEAARHLAERDPHRTAALLEQTTELVRDGLAEIRRSVARMRDDGDAPADLARAIRDLVERSNTARLRAEVAADLTFPDLPPPDRLVAWRVAQEGLTNAHRHAEASRCVVSTGRDTAGNFLLHVDDDGRGLHHDSDPDADARHFGLAGLRERAHERGGRIALGPSPLGGCRLTLTLPPRP